MKTLTRNARIRRSRATAASRNRRGAPPPPNAQSIIRGVLAILKRRGKVLLIRRAANVRAGGAWCFPGGTIEPGESEAAALVREMQEELNLIVEPRERLLILRKRRGQLVLHCWSARIVGGRLRPNPAEVAEARWIKPADVRCWPQVPGSPPCEDVPHLITGSLTILDRLEL